ncbi:MAG: hypothetical protein Q7R87_02060 [Nanoarchaeota archaeon]|nr:hypothetical protein [Nanoarchaeota archaeon]
MIIGVTGYIGAGKGEFVNLLKDKYKFVPVTFKEVIVLEANRIHAGLDRVSLQKIGRDLEKQGVLAERVVQEITRRESLVQGQNYVVECFRTKNQVREFKDVFGEDFYLVGITAGFDVRWGRIRERDREGDPELLKDFIEADKKDRGIGKYKKNTYQNSEWCVNHADYLLNNDGDDLHFFKKDASEVMDKILT